ncbi:MAG TPA: DUF1508 domain-containing protein [Acidimicrobiia bacterium]|nr:DUF1508 domain-containing protein [Acidimicrobiia bacterium]
MAAKFEIQSPKAGEFRWVLVSQGRTLATSPAYTSKAAAQNGMASFRTAAGNAPLIDTTLRAARTPAGKAARTTGRAVGRAVVKSGRAVEKAEKAAARTTKRATTETTRAVKSAAKAATAPKRGGRAK